MAKVGRPTSIGDSVLVFEMVRAVAKYRDLGHPIESKKDPSNSAIGLAMRDILENRPGAVEVELEGVQAAMPEITLDTVRHAWNAYGKKWHGGAKRGAPIKRR